jgi:hypothetical protein
MMQNTGDRVKVLVNRPLVGMVELNLKVKSIL